MRVELSPWKYAETSLHHSRIPQSSTAQTPPAKRRRDRSESDVGQSKDELCCVATFIEQTSSSVRIRKKRMRKRVAPSEKSPSSKMEVEDRLPALILTTANRISVLVESDPSNKDSSSPSNSASGEFQESALLQFANRPDKSFLPSVIPFDINGATKQDASDDAIAPIPAVFDAFRNRAYALQDGNTTLVCFPSDTDDLERVITVRLECPAKSLSVVHLPRTKKASSRCLVYGTCRDARIFVACVVDSGNEPCFVIDYVGTASEAQSPSQANQHVGTIACVQTSNTILRKSETGNKRKVDDMSVDDTECHVLLFYQIFRDGQSLLLSQYRIEVSEPLATHAGVLSNGDSSWIRSVDDASRRGGACTTIQLVPNSHHKIIHATVLGLVDENDTVSIYYTISSGTNNQSKNTNGKAMGARLASLYTSVSLRSGRVSTCPIHLPATTNQVGLLGPALMAVLTSRHEIYVYDIARGAKVYTCQPLISMPNVGTNVRLFADPKRSRLAIGFNRDDRYVVAFTSARAENGRDMQSVLRGSRLSLAAGLGSSLQVLPVSAVKPTFALTRRLDGSLHKNSDAHKCITRGIQALEVAQTAVLSAEPGSLDPSFLLEAYSSALKLTRGIGSVPAREKNDDNPQDAVLATNGKRVNGFHHRDDAPRDVNQSESQHLQREIPQSFVDSAVSVVVSILCSSKVSVDNALVRNEARLMLRQLMTSGRVSARAHLAVGAGDGRTVRFPQMLRALEISSDEADGVTSAYTPFDFMNDMFSFCHDTSEHQMVAMIHFTMCRSQPNDVASYFVRENQAGQRHPYVAQSTRLLAIASAANTSAKERQELQGLQSKLIVSGIVHLVQCAVKYSKFNSSLLCDALRSELTRNEIVFLTRCLASVISGPFTFGNGSKVGSSSNAIRLVTVLCDGFREYFSQSDQKRIQQSVSTALSQTGMIVSLRTSLQEAADLADANKTIRSEVAHVASDRKDRGSLPSYQFERLVF